MMTSLGGVFPQRLLLIIFTLSGFAGLIYESIWTHYLKLFLGHAAYAQTLVLCIFMLGMALGSWVAAAKIKNIKNFFITYAKVELVLGIFALFFHEVSIFITNLFFDSIAPNIQSAENTNIIKWVIASALIIPQSILIGMTFPLVANGFLNQKKTNSGKNISLLYFSNSLGAAFGVLASGFLLINLLGLKLTMVVSGAVNIIIAVTIYYYFRQFESVRESETRFEQNLVSSNVYYILGFIAFLTGLASFIYEITWIRLISLILGSATHSFELMLSSFILGLALGGFFIRKRIDHLQNPIGALANIQLMMGIAAILSLLLYNYAFELMQLTYESLNRVSSSFFIYNLISHLICLLVMLPATIFAGMTLPLITKILVDDGGAQNIGKVYAFNTLGSIIGVLVCIHLLFPTVGAGNALFIGALVDIIAGLGLMMYFRYYTSVPKFAGICAASILCFAMLFTNANLNVNKLVSGVFRNGLINYEREVLYYKDGKTASVSVFETDGSISLATNGKPDASIRSHPERSADEPTQVLAGIIPVLSSPNPERVAVIGFGSGMTTHSVLASKRVKSIDTIEIEPAIVEGARYLSEKSWRAFEDQRSNIYYEDAKTFFSNNKSVYDLIIAEPSNPWVSGVSSLFSEEFYSKISHHISDGGIFSQWVQTYELSPELLATVANALAEHFAYYQIYLLDDSDLLVVASNNEIEPILSIKSNPEIARMTAELGIDSDSDLTSHYFGNKKLFENLFLSFNRQKNSDYFPVLDQNAVRSRYLKHSSEGILYLKNSGLPLAETIFSESLTKPVGEQPYFSIQGKRKEAFDFAEHLLRGEHFAGHSYEYLLFLQKYQNCSENESEEFWEQLPWLLTDVISNLPYDIRAELWPLINKHACLKKRKPEYKQGIQLVSAINFLNYQDVSILSEALLKEESSQSLFPRSFYAKAWLWAKIMTNSNDEQPFELASIKSANNNNNWVLYFLYALHQNSNVTDSIGDSYSSR